MRLVVMMLMLVSNAVAQDDISGKLVTVIQFKSRVTTRDGELKRHIPIGARILVRAVEGDRVVLSSADLESPPEYVDRDCVVPSEEAAEHLRRRAESEDTAAAWNDYHDFLSKQDPLKAFNCLVRALERDPDYVRTYIGFGREFELIGKEEEAELAYVQAEHLGRFFDLHFGPEHQWFGRSHTIGYVHPHVHGLAPRTYRAFLEIEAGLSSFSTSASGSWAERHRRAEEHFRNALGQDLNCIAAWCELSNVAASQGKLDEAILAMSAIVDRRPDDHVHLLDRARLWERKNEFDLAKRDFDVAVVVAGTCSCALRQRSEFFRRQSCIPEAIADLESAFRIDKKQSQILAQMVRLQAETGDIDGALKTCRRLDAVEKQQMALGPYEGCLWEAKRDFPKALECYRSVPYGAIDACRLSMKLRDFEGALEDCDRMLLDCEEKILESKRRGSAITYQDRLAICRRTRGYLLEQLGRHEHALVEYREWSRLSPNDRHALATCARVQQQSGLVAEAAATLNRAWKLEKVTSPSLIARGRLKMIEGDAAGAVDDLSEAISLEPNNWVALNARARLRATSPDDTVRDGRLALADAQRCQQILKSPNYEFLVTLAAAHAELGEFAAAENWIAQAKQHAHDPVRERILIIQAAQYRNRVPHRIEPWEAYLPTLQ